MKNLLLMSIVFLINFQSYAQTTDTTFAVLKVKFEDCLNKGDTSEITKFYEAIDSKNLTKNEYYYFHFMYNNFMGNTESEMAASKNNFGLDFGFKQIDTNAKYCLILATQRFLSKKVVIDVDFGQERYMLRNTTRLLDQAGHSITFNSVIDVLNYMNNNGWQFVDAYAITVGRTNVYHYLMKKS